jgi:hypothetical protein
MVVPAPRLRVLAGRMVRHFRLALVVIRHVGDVDAVAIFRMGATGKQGQDHGAAAERPDDRSTLDIRRLRPVNRVRGPLRGIAVKHCQPASLLPCPEDRSQHNIGLEPSPSRPDELPDRSRSGPLRQAGNELSGQVRREQPRGHAQPVRANEKQERGATACLRAYGGLGQKRSQHEAIHDGRHRR